MLSEYKNFIQNLQLIQNDCSELIEDWGSIELKSEYDNNIFTRYKNVYDSLLKIQGSSFVKFKFDSDEVVINEIEDYENKPNSFYKSSISINKQGLLQKFKIGSDYFNFFLTSVACCNWLTGLNTLDEKNPINRFSPLILFVWDLNDSLGSELLYFADRNYTGIKPLTIKHNLPSLTKLKENIHFISDFKIAYNIDSYNLSYGDYSTDLGQAILSQSLICLGISVVNEFYDYQNVIVNGVKLMNLKVIDTEENYDYSFLLDMINLIDWMYEDRVSTRKKLFNERLSLETKDEESLLTSLKKHLTPALNQAKERFNFVILDRKDAYLKELKELLKDLRANSDLYSLKIRTLLNNFLRDLLATIVLIGFTIFTKFSDNLGLNKAHLLDYVFNGLGLYFILSIIIQATVDITDIVITDKELKYWKEASKELISETEFERHYTKSLSFRKYSIYVLYPIFVILYLTVSWLCFKYPQLLANLIPKN